MELRIVLYFWLMLAWWGIVPPQREPVIHVAEEITLLVLFVNVEIIICRWHEARFAKPPEEGGAR